MIPKWSCWLLCNLCVLFSTVLGSFTVYKNTSYPMMPGLEPMSSDKQPPHFTVIESVSRTKAHRHKRQVIAGPVYEWQSFEIPFQIWGGDGRSFPHCCVYGI